MFTGEFSLDSSVISWSFGFLVACSFYSSRSLILFPISDSQSLNDLAFSLLSDLALSLLSLIALFLYWLLTGLFLKSWAVASRCSFSFLEDEGLDVL